MKNNNDAVDTLQTDFVWIKLATAKDTLALTLGS